MPIRTQIKILLLLAIGLNTIVGQPKKDCLEWFPEPVSFKTSDRNERLHEVFRNVRDLLVERDASLDKRLEEFVLDTMNSKSTGLRDVNSIAFHYLPSVRQVFIAILCMIAAEVIFVAVWQLSLSEYLSDLVESFHFFDKYRFGISIFPLLYFICIIVTSAHISPNVLFLSEGIAKFETSNDQSFMPIKTRLQKKLEQVPCIFRRDYRGWKLGKRRSDLFLNDTIGGVSFDSLLAPVWSIKSNSTTTEACSVLEGSLKKSVKKLNDSIVFQVIFDEKMKLTEEFMDNIEEQLKKSLRVYAKALVSIEEFVEEYHDNVLFLPSQALISVLHVFVRIKIFVTMAITVSITILVIIKFEVKTKVGKWVSMSSVFCFVFFSIICMLISITILLRVSFTSVVRDEILKNDLALLGKLNVRNFSENGQHYHLNYTDMLLRAAQDQQTLYQVIKETDRSLVPTAIRPEFLFRPSKKYNETVERTADLVVKKYPGYVKKTCELLNSTWQDMTSRVQMGQCAEKQYAEAVLKVVNRTMNSACSLSMALQSSPPNSQKIHGRAFDAWKKLMLPPSQKGLFNRNRATDDTNPMQVYFVFENPEKKLEPTILEPLFGIAVCTLVMAPFYFLLATHFMIVLPLILDVEETPSTTEKREEDEVTALSQ